MYHNTLSIPIAFIVLIAVNLWITIAIRSFWWLKILLIAASLTLGVFVWGALESYVGWPSGADLPEEYQVLWVFVQEPTADKEGQIFLWARPVESEMDLVPYDLFIYKPEVSEPRAFYLDYTRNLHEQSQKAIESLKQGKIVIGKKSKSDAAESMGSNSGQNQEGTEANSQSGNGSTEGGDPYFFELPPTKFIEKEE